LHPALEPASKAIERFSQGIVVAVGRAMEQFADLAWLVGHGSPQQMITAHEGQLYTEKSNLLLHPAASAVETLIFW
jgi:hypothetical protein